MRLQNIKANIPEISIDWDINFQESDNIICIIDTKKAKFSFLHLFGLLLQLDIQHVKQYLCENGTIQCIGQKSQEPFAIYLKAKKEIKTDLLEDKKAVGTQSIVEETYLFSEQLNNMFQNYKYAKSWREFLYPRSIYTHYRVFYIDGNADTLAEEISKKENRLTEEDFDILVEEAEKYPSLNDDICDYDIKAWLDKLNFIKYLYESLGFDGNIPIILDAYDLYRDFKEVLENVKNSWIYDELKKISGQIFILLDEGNTNIEKHCDKVIRL